MIIRVALLSCVLTAQSLAQQPTFDAASVKLVDPAHPDSSRQTGGPGNADPGRIHYGRAAMITLLTTAYGVEIDQISGPAWMSDFMGPNLYIVDATMPPDTTKEQFQSMMRNLLAERFHLSVHHETRNFPGYNLAIAKDGPKLKESTLDPNATASDTQERPKIGKDGSVTFPPGPHMMNREERGAVHLKGQEQPISALVRHLWAGIPVALGGDMMDFAMPRARVTDKTGLTGKYDFTLDYACEGCRGLAAMAPNLPILAGRAPADPPPPSEPMGSGLPTIFAAIEKQLGLKLEKTAAVPLDVIVVDRVDKVPTQN